MLREEELAHIVQLVTEQVEKNRTIVDSRNSIRNYKEEQSLMDIIRKVVRDYCKGLNYAIEEIVKKVRSYFPR